MEVRRRTDKIKARKRTDEKLQGRAPAEQTLCRKKCVSDSIKTLEGKQEVGGMTQQRVELGV